MREKKKNHERTYLFLLLSCISVHQLARSLSPSHSYIVQSTHNVTVFTHTLAHSQCFSFKMVHSHDALFHFSLFIFFFSIFFSFMLISASRLRLERRHAMHISSGQNENCPCGCLRIYDLRFIGDFSKHIPKYQLNFPS